MRPGHNSDTKTPASGTQQPPTRPSRRSRFVIAGRTSVRPLRTSARPRLLAVAESVGTFVAMPARPAHVDASGLATLIGLSHDHVRRLAAEHGWEFGWLPRPIAEGVLPHWKRGGPARRWWVADIETWLEANEQPSPWEGIGGAWAQSTESSRVGWRLHRLRGWSSDSWEEAGAAAVSAGVA